MVTLPSLVIDVATSATISSGCWLLSLCTLCLWEFILRYCSLIQHHICAHVAFGGTVITDRAVFLPMPQRPKPALTDFGLSSHTAAHVPSQPLLKVSTSIIHVNTWITTHLSTPEGWKAEFALLVDP